MLTTRVYCTKLAGICVGVVGILVREAQRGFEEVIA